MGRKKKEPVQGNQAPAQGNQAPVETKEVNGQVVQGKEGSMIAAAEVIVDPDKETMVKDAQEWAIECGFRGEFRIDGPNLERFPRYGHGYVFTIRELQGKQRMATAKYTKDGMRSFWQMDGMITG
jgi:hypothetical protein